MLKEIKKLLLTNNLDGYIVPKNDEYFSEYASPDRLLKISKFSGSAGFAILMKNKNYLFVDGRYTLQAQLESGSNFKIFPLTAFEFPTFNFCSSSLLIFFFNSIIIDELLGITPSVKAEMYFEN